MTILVNRCYDWVSFHLINELLNNGYDVIGINDSQTDLTDHLSMFLGRNSSFVEGFADYKNIRFRSAFLTGNFDPLKEILSDQIFILNTEGETGTYKPKTAHTTIEPPLLFGEWMPMNKNGMYKNDQFISFNSEDFKEHAVFIEDFCRLLCSWLQDAAYLPSKIELLSSKNRKSKALKLENSVYIHDNRPIVENLEKVLTHYGKFSRFYNKYN